jgi:hypothetical protein
MALKRWRWVWGPLLAAGFVVVLTLPPGIPTETGILSVFGLAYSPWQYPPGMVHRAAVEGALNQQRRRLRAEMLADSILVATHGPRVVRSSDGAVTIVYEDPIAADSARFWLRATLAELDLYPKGKSGGLPIVVALLSSPRRHPDLRNESQQTSVLWRPRTATAGPACILTVNLRPQPRSWWPGASLVVHDPGVGPVGRFLDYCALGGRYGAPGASVARWAGSSPEWYWRASSLATRLWEARRSVRKEDIPREWQFPFWYGQVSWVGVGCLDGDESLCARTAGLGTAGASGSDFYFEHRLIIGHLLATGTADQFASFWRSPLAPRAALQQAYRLPPGRIALEAFRHWYDVPPAPPRAEPRLMLAGLLWAGAALALALVAGRRWTTEI